MVRIGDINDIEKFSELMLITEARKNFLSYDLDYYKKLYEIYNKDNKFLLFMGSVNPKEIFNKYNKNSLNMNILKKLYCGYKILGKINLNINYNLLINKNIKYINGKIKQKIKTEYLKVS